MFNRFSINRHYTPRSLSAYASHYVVHTLVSAEEGLLENTGRSACVKKRAYVTAIGLSGSRALSIQQCSGNDFRDMFLFKPCNIHGHSKDFRKFLDINVTLL